MFFSPLQGKFLCLLGVVLLHALFVVVFIDDMQCNYHGGAPIIRGRLVSNDIWDPLQSEDRKDLGDQVIRPPAKLKSLDKNAVVTVDDKQRTFDSAEHYYLPEDTDSRPIPVDDWGIRREFIPKQFPSVLTLTIWVSSEGHIDYYLILQQSPLGDWAERVLSGLQFTRMIPAIRRGKTVASSMTIELLFDGTETVEIE